MSSGLPPDVLSAGDRGSERHAWLHWQAVCRLLADTKGPSKQSKCKRLAKWQKHLDRGGCEKVQRVAEIVRSFSLLPRVIEQSGKVYL